MKIGSVFENNRTQAVRLPAGSRFGKDVKKVIVRTLGHTRILEPLDKSWDSFFKTQDKVVSEDFLDERADQYQGEREEF